MALAIRRFNTPDGERRAVLVDETGRPLFYPNLWATVHLRNGGLAVNTIQNALNAIKCLYAWLADSQIDVERRFSTGHLLQAREVHSLRDFFQNRLRQKAHGKVVQLSRKVKTVDRSTQYARMTAVADYLGFLAKELQPSSARSEEPIAAMVAQIKANRPSQSTKTSGRERDEKSLDDSALDALEERLKPGAEHNPFKGSAVQFRNALIFAIARVTGMRRGELLNLKIEDIDFSKNTLKIVRRPDSIQDTRTYQPVAKTREREFPLDAELVGRMYDYVMQYRSKIPRAKAHGYLFVTHKKGPSYGDPMSNSAFSKFTDSLKSIVAGIHMHKLRHHWNYTFSKMASEKALTPAREEKLRSYLMGWDETSGMAAIYNQRHIKKEAGEASLAHQRKLLGKNGSRVDE